MDNMKTARESLVAEMGKEMLLEMAGTGAFFELITKVADCTGKTPLPSFAVPVVKSVMAVLRGAYDMWSWFFPMM
jgi:hypothetical protein